MLRHLVYSFRAKAMSRIRDPKQCCVSVLSSLAMELSVFPNCGTLTLNYCGVGWLSWQRTDFGLWVVGWLLAVNSWLWTPWLLTGGCGLIPQDCFLWTHGCRLLVVDSSSSWLIFLGCAHLAEDSWRWVGDCGFLDVHESHRQKPFCVLKPNPS